VCEEKKWRGHPYYFTNIYGYNDMKEQRILTKVPSSLQQENYVQMGRNENELSQKAMTIQ
jgi:hypothetical protein